MSAKYAFVEAPLIQVMSNLQTLEHFQNKTTNFHGYIPPKG